MRLIPCLIALCCSSLVLAAELRPLNLVTEDYPPFNMPGDIPGEVRGISTDIVRQLMRREERPHRIKLYPWQRAINMAQTTPDTCVYSMSRTPEREALYVWIGPLVHNNWVLFARETDATASMLSKIEDSKDKRIGSYQGDAIVPWLQSRGYKVDVAPRDELNPRKLLAGRIDLWATGGLIGQYLLRQQRIGGIVPRLTFNQTSMYLACHRDMPADEAKQLNHQLQQMREDGSIAAIYKRNGYQP